MFMSIKENLILDEDPRNMLMIHMLGAFGEFERAMIRERTMAGLARARAEGKTLGRPRKGIKKHGRIYTLQEEGVKTSD
jgi:DNA invertase Pin-like site-specific DNA recombinase